MGTLSSLLRHRETIRRRHHAVGYFNDRLDGISDILDRSEAHTVLEASLVHGCDIYREGLDAARWSSANGRFVWWPLEQFEEIDKAQKPPAKAPP